MFSIDSIYWNFGFISQEERGSDGESGAVVIHILL